MINYLETIKTILFLPNIVKQYPLHIQIDVTTMCNLSCKMCNSKKIISSSENNKHLTFEKFKIIVDKIRPRSINLAANGEPFLNPQIFDMLKYASEKKITTIISSNLILSEKIVRQIPYSGLNILKVSIDGARKETYEKIRGKNYEILTKNLSLITEINKNLQQNVLQIRFDFVIMKYNYKEILDYIEFAKKYNVNHIYFHPIDIRGYDEKKKNEIISDIEIEKLKRIIQEAEKVAQKYGIKTNLETLIKKYFVIENLYSTNKSLTIKRRVCLLPWLSMFISISGETSPCCAIYPRKDNTFGNVFDCEFKDIWNSKKIVDMRILCKSLDNYKRNSDCKNCLPMDFNTITNSVFTFPNYFKETLKFKK